MLRLHFKRRPSIRPHDSIPQYTDSGDPQVSPYRWVMLALLASLYGSFGLANRSMPPLVTPILRDLRMSYSEMGIILGSWQLIFVGGSIAAGMLLDRWGIRKSLLIGALIIAFSVGFRSLPQGFTGMLLAVALFGAGGPMLSIGCPKAISLWFKGKSRGRAVGIYIAGSFVGQLFSYTLTNSLVMPLFGYSWRLTFLSYGLICIGIAALWWFFGKELPLPETAETTGMIQMFKKLWKVRNVRILLAMGLLTFASTHGFINWLPKIIESSGMSPQMAGFLVSIPIAISIPSLLIFPGMIPSEQRGRFIALLSFLTMGTYLSIVMTSGIVQVIALVMYGILHSSFMPILVLILMDLPEIEPQLLSSAGGLFFCVGEMGGFSGPLIVGILVDLTGTFLYGAIFCASLNLLMIVLTFLLRTRAPSLATSHA
jgi:cyanate permease